jgi:hypothetical protein
MGWRPQPTANHRLREPDALAAAVMELIRN